MNFVKYRIRRDEFNKTLWRIDMLVSSKGYYITLPEIYGTFERAKKALDKMKK